ncbi:hypothetical protein Trydic_g19916 [Trypoxylus dichotomus]
MRTGSTGQKFNKFITVSVCKTMESDNTKNWADDKDFFLEDDASSLRRINQAALLDQVKQREDAIEQWNLKVRANLGAIKAEKRAIDALKSQVKNITAERNGKKEVSKKKRSCPTPTSDEEEGNAEKMGKKTRKPKGRTPGASCSDELSPKPGPSNEAMDTNTGGQSVHSGVAGYGV